MTHHDRDAIHRRFREADRFVLDLAHGDTAWDPETGDSLLGPARVTFARGEFPGPALTATIDRLTALQAPYDTDAQHARDLALVGFLDLTLAHWETWLGGDASAGCPPELEPYAVSVITALRDTGDNPEARGDYLQAVASLDTSALQYFVARVGAH